MSGDLLDTKGIADLLGVTREYVTDKLVKRPGFPEPVVGVSQRLRRWRASDVERFCKAPPRRAAMSADDSR